MGGKPCVSGSRLLNIPAEILANIVDFIADDQPTLAALALVNSDCRQLARSCQFVDICFDYSPRAFDLLLALLRETVPSVSTASQPTIGACIRKVTVKSDRQWVASTHWELYQSNWGDTRVVQPRAKEGTSRASNQDIQLLPLRSIGGHLRCHASPRDHCMVRSSFCGCRFPQSHLPLAHQTSQAVPGSYRCTLSHGTSLDTRSHAITLPSSRHPPSLASFRRCRGRKCGATFP